MCGSFDAYRPDMGTAASPRVLVIGLDPYRVPGPWDPEPVAKAIEAGMAPGRQEPPAACARCADWIFVRFSALHRMVREQKRCDSGDPISVAAR